MGVRLEISHSVEIDAWIRERHYLQSVPCGARIRMAFRDRGQEIIGAMLWGRPTARKIDQWKILELTRMYFMDETPPFIESHCLSLARKHIRKHKPEIKGLIAYSSTGEGHKGAVYEADGWFLLGVTTNPPSWTTRPNRSDRDRSDKLRWVRSP